MIGPRAQLIAGLAALMVFGWWVTAQPPFSTSGTIGILVAGAALIVLARLWRHRVPVHDESVGLSDATGRLRIWLVILGLLVAWELITFFLHPRDAYPTISSMADSLQAEHAVRWLLFGGWLGLGWSLAA